MQFKKTPLYEKHLEFQGKVIEFGGYLLPVEYKGIAKEHLAVRENVGVFDVSHMGEVLVTGKDTIKYLEKMITSNITKLENGHMQYGILLYPNGTIVDDLMIYKINNEKIMIICNASNTEKDYKYFLDNAKDYDVCIENQSNIYSQLALQGPNAYQVLAKICTEDITNMKMYDFNYLTILDSQMVVSRSGYTGGDGFEIYGSNEKITSLFDVLVNKYNVMPCGLGCRDTLRFEASLPLYGHEISDKINPVMATLNFACDYSKDFIGRDALLEYKKNPQVKLVGLELLERGIARSEYEVLDDNKNVIGYVTTGYQIPGSTKALAMAYVPISFAKNGTNVFVRIRKKDVKAVIRDKKFMNKNYIK